MLKRLLLVLSILLVFMIYFASLQDKEMNVQNENSSDVQIHFLSTGNSDCILIVSDKVMMIDAAGEDDESYIIQYLEDLKINKIDYLLSTHPHADHIGSMDAVIRNFKIDNLIMCEGINHTKEYYDFQAAVEEKNLTKHFPIEDMIIRLGEDVEIVFMNCLIPDTDDKNDWSIVTELRAGDVKALFMGDAQLFTEKKISSKVSDVDILKVGHHGDITSSSQKFLDAITPEYAVITTGKNTYGHPSDIVLKQLENMDVKVYRTDLDGDVVFEISNNRIIHSGISNE